MEDSDGTEDGTEEKGVIRGRGLFSGRRETLEPLVQDDSNYMYYWTCIEDSGFPNRVNHAVATHR